jgi:quinol monooxygenase YgiN
MKTQIDVIARCSIHPGKLESFRKVAALCLTNVRQKERGAMRYDWFLNADQKECVVIERYRDSGAVLEHIANLGENLEALTACCDLWIELYGNPSKELAETAAAMPVPVLTLMQGID